MLQSCFRTTGRFLAMGSLLVAAHVFAVEPPDEDGNRIRQYWDTAMSPADYRNALAATGMDAVSSGAGIGSPDGANARGGGGWFSTGPVGGIVNDSGQSVNAFGGRISGLQLRTDASGYHVYAGACSGGLWRAHNSSPGVWTSLGDKLPNPSVRAFSVHPTNASDIIVGTGDLSRVGGSGMYRTTNEGASWSPVSLPVSPMSFGRILRSPTDVNLLVASCISGGVLRSSNGGASWVVTLTGSVNDIVFEPGNFNIQYAAKDGVGVFRSIDAGANWTQMSLILPTGVGFSHGFLAVCRDEPWNVGLFLSQSEFQVFRSTNRGTSWSNITGTLGQPGEGAWHMNEFGHTGAIAFRPNDADEIYVGARGFQKTSNNGATWDDVLDTHPDITQLFFGDQSGDSFLWICCDGGIVGRTIGGSITNWNGNATTGLRCYQVDFLDSKRGIRAIGTQDNGANYTTNGGGTWLFSNGGDAWDCEIVNDLTLEFWHADGVSSGPAIRVNRRKSSGLTPTNNNAESMDGLFYSRFSNRMYSIGADDLIYGCNVGSSPLTWVVDGTIPSQLAIRKTPTGSYVDGRTLYANTADPTGGFPVPVLMIARLGGPWAVQTYDFGGTGGVQSIYASTEIAGEVWVTMGRSGPGEPLIYHSADYGGNWTDVTGNLTSLKNVRCLAQKPFEPHVLYAGTDIGVFLTTDGGTTWQPFQTGLPIVTCTDIRYVVDAAHAGNDRLVVATYGRGIYERAIPSFPLVYVHEDSPRTTEDGTYDHPFDTLDEGRSNLPFAGSLALYGDTYLTGPITLSTPMTLRAYGGNVRVGQ